MLYSSYPCCIVRNFVPIRVSQPNPAHQNANAGTEEPNCGAYLEESYEL